MSVLIKTKVILSLIHPLSTLVRGSLSCRQNAQKHFFYVKRINKFKKKIFTKSILKNYGGIKTALSKSKIHVFILELNKNGNAHEFGSEKCTFTYQTEWNFENTKSNENKEITWFLCVTKVYRNDHSEATIPRDDNIRVLHFDCPPLSFCVFCKTSVLNLVVIHNPLCKML